MERTDELFAPRRLAELVRALLRDGPPAEPIDVEGVSTPPAVRDRRPAVAAERLRPQLHARRRLAALVLGPVDERDDLLDDVVGRTPRAAPRASGRARRTPRAPGRGSSYGGIESSSRWSARSSALGARSIVARRDELAPRPLVQVPREPEHVGLVDVLQEREPADHVAVERRVADRELRLVPGRDHEPAVRVRERHQQDAAHARLEVLGREALRASARRARAAPRGTPRRRPRSGSRGSARPRLAASRRGVRARPLGREAATASRRSGRARRPSASTQSAAVTAESMPPGHADHDVREAVLLDVVAEAERERASASARARARTATIDAPPRSLGAPAAPPARRPRPAGTVSRERSSSRRRTSRSRRPTASSGSTSTTSRCSSKPGARATTSPASSSTTEWPSKTSSSWPPTRLQNARYELVSRARVTSISSRSSALPTWNGDAERLTRSCAPASARSVAGGPGCQMSSQIVEPAYTSPSWSSTRSRPSAK